MNPPGNTARLAMLEDDPDQAALVKRWLEGRGYYCAHFETGADFLDAVESLSPDLVLLDWHLADVNGDEVLRVLRVERGISTPVVFLTAADSSEVIATAMRAGADEFLPKPIDRHRLFACLGALLGTAESGQGIGGSGAGPFALCDDPPAILRDGKPVALSEEELVVGQVLLRNVDRLLAREQLLERAQEAGCEIEARRIDSILARLRLKLGIGRRDGWSVATIHGYGYRLESAPPDPPGDK